MNVYRYAAFCCSVVDCGAVLGMACEPPEFAETQIEVPSEPGDPQVTSVQKLVPGWSIHVLPATEIRQKTAIALLCPKHREPGSARLSAPGVFMCTMPDCQAIMRGVQQNNANQALTLIAARMQIKNGWNIGLGMVANLGGAEPFIALLCPQHSKLRDGLFGASGEAGRA